MDFKLTVLAEEISRLSSINSSHVVISGHSYADLQWREQATQGKVQNVLFEKGRSTRKCKCA